MSYSERLLQKGSNLTRLAHQSRFKQVLSLVAGQQYDLALDYGCGDGWLLNAAYQQGSIRSGVGIDVDPAMLQGSRELFRQQASFQFCYPHEANQYLAPASCDLVFCTETLEHVNSIPATLEQIRYFAKPGARVIISAPIEIGPALLFKQVGRYLANLKGNYGYERYTPAELLDAVVFWRVDGFPSSHNGDVPFRAHKGFDYRKLDRILAETLTLEERIFSPMPLFQQLLNSTVIWKCRV